jgi:hypothetical protein
MYSYRIYGLRIASSRRIALLREESGGNIDVTVQWHTRSHKAWDETVIWTEIKTELLGLMEEVTLWESRGPNGISTKVDLKVDEARILSFVLDTEKNALDIYYPPDVSEEDLESYFVGPILSFVLRLREHVCLHASAVGVNGKAIVFLGHSTAGKSTTAAGMAQAGAAILADDIVALSVEAEGFYVQPGYTRVRLRPKAADFLTPNPSELPRVYSHRDSFYYAFSDSGRFAATALPIGAIYLLGEISEEYTEPFIKPVVPQERLIKLVANASGIYVVRGERRGIEFDSLSRIANTVPMRKLYHAHDIKTLPKQCEIILDDILKLAK